jgi:hypothetical protein
MPVACGKRLVQRLNVCHGGLLRHVSPNEHGGIGEHDGAGGPDRLARSSFRRQERRRVRRADRERILLDRYFGTLETEAAGGEVSSDSRRAGDLRVQRSKEELRRLHNPRSRRGKLAPVGNDRCTNRDEPGPRGQDHAGTRPVLRKKRRHGIGYVEKLHARLDGVPFEQGLYPHRRGLGRGAWATAQGIRELDERIPIERQGSGQTVAEEAESSSDKHAPAGLCEARRRDHRIHVATDEHSFHLFENRNFNHNLLLVVPAGVRRHSRR